MQSNLTYAEYIQSRQWTAKRKQYFHSDLPQGCQGCGYVSAGIHLHHRTYVRMGHERLSDLVPVCKDCHGRIHENFDMRMGNLAARTETVLNTLRKEHGLGTWMPGRASAPAASTSRTYLSRNAKRRIRKSDRRLREESWRRSHPTPAVGRRDPNVEAFARMRDAQRSNDQSEIRRRNGLS